MPHDIGSTRNSVAIDTNAFNSADATPATGKTRDGRSVSAFSPQEPFLLAIKGPATPRRALSSFTVSNTEPRTTFNDPQKQTSAMAIPEATSARGGRSQSKMGSNFLQGAVDRLVNKGYSRTEADTLVRNWQDKPGASKRSVRKLVINTPYKDLARQETFDKVTSDLLRMGYNTKSARKLAEGIVFNMPHPADGATAVVAAPKSASSGKANVEEIGAKEPASKKKGFRTRMKELLMDKGYEEKEAREVVKEVVHTLGGWPKCDKRQVKNIIKGMSEKEASPDHNLTREEALSILKLDESASPQDIKKSYRKLARANHPDKHIGAEPEIQKEKREVFERAQRAYDRLTKE